MAKVRFVQQPSNPSPKTEEVVRLILGEEVAGLVHYGPRARQGHDPEAVHQLRVKSRRLRSELEIVAPAIKAKAYKQLRGELRWASGILGRERDLDVLYELLDSLSAEPNHALDADVLSMIDHRRTAESRKVRTMIRSKRYRRLVGALSAAVVDPPLRDNAALPARQVLQPGLEYALSNLFGTVQRFGPSPTDRELHDIRILTKRARYCCDVTATYHGESANHVSAALARAQAVLGAIHDQSEAINFLFTQRMMFDRDFAFMASSESPSAAIEWLSHSVSDLKFQWREPLREAKILSESLRVRAPRSLTFFETH